MVQPAILLWELSHRQRSGVMLAEVRGLRASPVRIELFRGWVHAIDWFPLKWTSGPPPSQGDEQLRAILKRDDVDWRFDDKLPLLKRGPVAPFHPAAVIRNVIAADGEAFRARTAAGARLQLVSQPHPSCIGLDERALVAMLASPRTLEELERAQLTPPARVVRLCAFLEAVGALSVDSELSLASAYALLELADGAGADEVKSAYRRLARALHPDVHPNASAEELRELERRFAAVSAAYRRLV
ncbi:MAG TPA: J domain-containing protein [Polyangia bacterium]|nr:J domain-containing protein [Polyangia bacterium]